MSAQESVVMRVGCEDENCGMWSAYRFWMDGSYRKVLEACWHPKRMPTREKITAEIEKEAA